MTLPADKPRVVATPGTMSGQPRIDGTRMTVAQLLAYMRGGMSVEEISAEWPHLPPDWWEAIIEWIDSQAAPEVDVAAVQAILDRIPDVPPAPGDELPYEALLAFGSGNVARDLGIPNPEAVTFKWRLARLLASAMRDRSLDAAALAELAGEFEPAQIDRITKGLVRDVDTYEITQLLAALGYRVIVDVLPPQDGVDGLVWINEPDGYPYDETSIEVLKGMAPPKKGDPSDL